MLEFKNPFERKNKEEKKEEIFKKYLEALNKWGHSQFAEFRFMGFSPEKVEKISKFGVLEFSTGKKKAEIEKLKDKAIEAGVEPEKITKAEEAMKRSVVTLNKDIDNPESDYYIHILKHGGFEGRGYIRDGKITGLGWDMIYDQLKTRQERIYDALLYNVPPEHMPHKLDKEEEELLKKWVSGELEAKTQENKDELKSL